MTTVHADCLFWFSALPVLETVSTFSFHLYSEEYAFPASLKNIPASEVRTMMLLYKNNWKESSN